MFRVHASLPPGTIAEKEIYMNAVQFVNGQFAAMRRVSDGVTGDLTDDLLNWMPPGSANPIAATLIHSLYTEDSFIQKTMLGKSSIWDTGGWSEKIGLTVLPGRGACWEEVRVGRYSIEAIRAYQEAVRAGTNAYVEVLTAAELDRQVTLHGNQRSVGDVLALLLIHTAHHAGEVAALKGIQGAKGLPF
jgi:hypothetical protein